MYCESNVIELKEQLVDDVKKIRKSEGLKSFKEYPYLENDKYIMKFSK